MQENNDTKAAVMTALTYIGMCCVLIAILMPALSMPARIADLEAFRYVYAAGALATLAGRLFRRRLQGTLRLRRLYRLETWSALFFCAGAVMLFYDKANLRDPVLMTLCGALVIVYTSIMIPRELRK